MIQAGENIQEIAIHNAILDFSNSRRLHGNDSIFRVEFNDSVFHRAFLVPVDETTSAWTRGDFVDGIVHVGILAHRVGRYDEDGCLNRYFYTAETRVGSRGKLPSRHIIKDGKLFYWWDNDYPLTEEMLAVLWKYDLICVDTVGHFGFLNWTLDSRQKGMNYYFCRNDLSRFRRVVTNRAHGFYEPPRLRCN